LRGDEEAGRLAGGGDPGFRSCRRFYGMITGVDAGRGVAC
jgi:hypothetical protein